MKPLRQTWLSRPTPGGQQVTITWIPADRRVHVGSIISLKGSREKWRVDWQSQPLCIKPVQDWRVGGLI